FTRAAMDAFGFRYVGVVLAVPLVTPMATLTAATRQAPSAAYRRRNVRPSVLVVAVAPAPSHPLCPLVPRPCATWPSRVLESEATDDVHASASTYDPPSSRAQKRIKLR